MELPAAFTQEMQQLLGDEYEQFVASLQQPRTHGLRVNTLKTSASDFLARSPFNLTPIPWCPAGFYYDDNQDRPGRSPLYHAGLFYLQEPSAMAAVPQLCIQPEERVLDLCAAPGGKATYIASALRGTGLLVANEYHNSRVRALGENLERWGATNTIITNTSSIKLASVCRGFFDKVLIDAPCSGQGMFRKDPFALKDWSQAKVAECSRIQEDLLEDGYHLLRPGGRLLYSTCTFTQAENEDRIKSLLTLHPDMELVRSFRLWPHHVQGEGHFLALLHKHRTKGPAHRQPTASNPRTFVTKPAANTRQKTPREFLAFIEQHLEPTRDLVANTWLSGEHLFLIPEGSPDLASLGVLRPGLLLGSVRKGRFQPSHALGHALATHEFRHVLHLSNNSTLVKQFLAGHPLTTQQNRRWIGVAVDGHVLGWGKEVAGTVKNHYPKGLRSHYS